MDSSTPNQTYQPVKSAVAAGLLGIFLGGVGAHSWYLGDKKKGFIHLGLWGGGFIVTIISSVIVGLATATSIYGIPFVSVFFGLLAFLGYIAMIGNSIWALVEAIIILAQGDAGLAAKGYAVAAPAVYQQPATPAAPVAAAPAEPAKTEHKSDSKTESETEDEVATETDSETTKKSESSDDDSESSTSSDDPTAPAKSE